MAKNLVELACERAKLAEGRRSMGLRSSARKALSGADRLASFAQRRGLGGLERRIALRGVLPVESGESVAAELCLVAGMAYLLGVNEQGEGVAIALTAENRVRYQRRRLGDRLVLGDTELEVPRGKGRDALELIAEQNLRKSSATVDTQNRYMSGLSQFELRALANWSKDDDPLLACLVTGSEHAFLDSTVVDDHARFVFLMSEHRSALMSVSSVGEVELQALEPAEFQVEGSEVRAGVYRWDAAKNAETFRQLQRAHALIGGPRTLEIARLNWVHAERGTAVATHQLLQRLVGKGNTAARLCQFWIRIQSGEVPTADVREQQQLLERFAESAVSTSELAELWTSWNLRPRSAAEFLNRVDPRGEMQTEICVRLSRAEWRVRQSGAADIHEQTAADLHHTRQLLQLGQADAARELAQRRYDQLSASRFLSALPPDVSLPDSIQTTTALSRQISQARVQAQELALEAAATPEQRLASAHALALLQPLRLERLQTLRQMAQGALAERAEHALEALQRGILAVDADLVQREDVRLPDELVEIELRHPFARRGSDVLATVQGLLASTRAPDSGALRLYCERLSPSNQQAYAALQRAARVLGVPRVDAYVSRGERDIGIRAFEGDPPFILIGGQHLDETSEYHLTPRELCFALGTEVAHLRFEHTRVTSNEVWEGAFDKSKQSIDIVISLLPILRGISLADRVGRAATRLSNPTVRRAMDNVSRVGRKLKGVVRIQAAPNIAGEDRRLDLPSISPQNEQLIAAHRLMQLTADRAGLLVTDDIRAAIRAMLQVRRDYQALTSQVESSSLVEVLEAYTRAGEVRYYDLTMRIAALIAFYLSEEYELLRTRSQR